VVAAMGAETVITDQEQLLGLYRGDDIRERFKAITGELDAEFAWEK
jgi:predicted Zn-dependent protease with MMP-like domain